MLRFGGYLLRFYGKDCKTGLAKIVAHLTNSSPSKKRFSNRPISFPGSNLDSGEITGNVIGSARSKDLTASARGLSPTSTTRSEAHRRWRARIKTSGIQGKLGSEKNSPFLLNEHGDPRISFQIFAKNNQIKNIFEEEKKFDTRTWFFWSPNECILAKARTSS